MLLHSIGSRLFGRVDWEFEPQSRALTERWILLLPLYKKTVLLQDGCEVVLYAEEIAYSSESGYWTGYGVRIERPDGATTIGLPESNPSAARQLGQSIAAATGLPLKDKQAQVEQALGQTPYPRFALGCTLTVSVLALGLPAIGSIYGLGNNTATWIAGLVALGGILMMLTDIPDMRAELARRKRRPRPDD